MSDIAKSARSRITNRPLAFEDASINTARGRRMRDLVEVLSAQAPAAIDEIGKSMIRKAAMLMMLLEEFENRFVSGQSIVVDEYSRLANTLNRTMEIVGIKPSASNGNGVYSDDPGDAFHRLLGRSENPTNGKPIRPLKADPVAEAARIYRDENPDYEKALKRVKRKSIKRRVDDEDDDE